MKHIKKACDAGCDTLVAGSYVFKNDIVSTIEGLFKMKKALLITPMSKNIIQDDSYDYIGVDSGALLLMEAKIPMRFAVGDFDSMTEDEFQRLQGACQIIRHPVQKNETDSELAVSLCKKKRI